MKTFIKLTCACSFFFLQSCGSQAEEEQLPYDLQASPVADLLRQEAILDSIVTAEEIEFAEQIVIKQQLRDLKLKLDEKKSRPSSGRDFQTVLTSNSSSVK